MFVRFRDVSEGNHLKKEQETGYKIFCYAEDDWPTKAQSVTTSAATLA